MNKVTLKSIFVGLLITPTIFYSKEKNTVVFTENKGQIHDQNNQARPDILFAASDGELNYYITSKGISYQQYLINNWKQEKISNHLENSIENVKTKPIENTIYRVDIGWLNANPNPKIKTDGSIDGYNNYYLEHCPNGALNVKSFRSITIENLYNGIKLHYYEKNGYLKCDYIIAPHANYKQIHLKVNGADIQLQKDGSLILNTPLGKILENAPEVFQNGKQLKAQYIVKNNIVSFEIKNYNPNHELIIDPVTRNWGTYYGGTSDDEGTACSTDASNNVYMSGFSGSATSSVIATSGSHQNTFGGSTYDAFLVKFNSAGVRQWGTYYGGAGTDYGTSCATDATGNIYLSGYTGSTGTVIATPGSHQPTNGGGADAFLVKFNSAGVRQWATYYGGIQTDNSFSCKTDALGNVYLAGTTASSGGTVIATAISHQPTYGGGTSDGYLVKFNSNGVRQWGTYYGGANEETGTACNTDASGNVFLAGIGSSSTGTIIASSGSHQTAFGGGTYDGYIVKFNSTGTRQWGTYYGGNSDDRAFSCAADASGNIYLVGGTYSSTGTLIATSGAHQTTNGGGSDAFLVKFNASGVRQWGTYYGGITIESGKGCCTDATGNVFLCGDFPNSNSSLATAGSYQTLTGGGTSDALIVKFNSAGVRQWGTFYGSSGTDEGAACATDGLGNIYLTGLCSINSTVIASSSSHQPAFGGSNDAYLAQLFDCVEPSSPTNTTPVANQTKCSNISTTLSAIGSGTISWFATPTGGSALSTGTNYVTPALGPGTYTYYAQANTCAISLTRTPITFTVVSNPTISVNSGSICSGKTFTMVPVGGVSYTYSSGSNTVSPTSNTSYTVTGSNAQGCANTAISSVSVNATPTINVSGGSVCPGGSFTINPSGASTYTYSNGQVVTPSTTTNYTVTGTSAQGCTATPVIITVTYTNSLTVGIVGSNTVCSGQPLVLTGSGASTYTWNTSATTNSISVSPTSNTTYSVIGASSTCSNTALISVTVMPNPTVTLSSSQPSVMCSGQSATLSASGASSYNWNTGSTSPSIVVSPTTTTTYTVIGTNSSGCSIISTLTQSVNTCTDIDLSLINLETKISVYPNPVNDVIFIEAPINSNYELTDSIGRLILNGILIDGKKQLELTELSQGVYFIKLSNDQHSTQTIKLIKTK